MDLEDTKPSPRKTVTVAPTLKVIPAPAEALPIFSLEYALAGNMHGTEFGREAHETPEAVRAEWERTKGALTKEYKERIKRHERRTKRYGGPDEGDADGKEFA